jgi:hypothetical protein
METIKFPLQFKCSCLYTAADNILMTVVIVLVVWSVCRFVGWLVIEEHC